MLEGSNELFTRGKKSQANDEGQAKEAELFQQIGKLQLELEWLKKTQRQQTVRTAWIGPFHPLLQTSSCP